MPKAKEDALAFSLVVKDEVIGPDKNTERNLRFAVVGGVTTQFPYRSALELNRSRNARKNGRDYTTVQRPTPSDRECGTGNV